MQFKYKLRSLLLVVLLVALYISGYRLLLTPDVLIVRSSAGIGIGYREPNFRYGGPALKLIYLPLVWLDHCIRPGYWDHYSTADHTRTTQDYSWGYVDLVDGYETSISMHPHSNKDVDDAIAALRGLHRITSVRVNGEYFNDAHLRALGDIRGFDFIELLATSVTRVAVDDFRKSNPTTNVTCVAVTETETALY